jgi:hypothetical protein
MRNVGFIIGISSMMLGVTMLAFGNGFGLIVLMAGTLGAIANK